ncbi:unnamed protein product [Ectocarpus sp. 13 AM-2016]
MTLRTPRVPQNSSALPPYAVVAIPNETEEISLRFLKPPPFKASINVQTRMPLANFHLNSVDVPSLCSSHFLREHGTFNVHRSPRAPSAKLDPKESVQTYRCT